MERIETLLHYHSREQALPAAFAGGPLALAYSRFDDVIRDQVHAEFLESISSFQNSAGDYEIPASSLRSPQGR